MNRPNFCKQGFAFVNRLKVVLDIGKLVFPTAFVIGTERHVTRVNSVRDLYQVLPDGETFVHGSFGRGERAIVSGAVEQLKVIRSELFLSVVVGE